MRSDISMHVANLPFERVSPDLIFRLQSTDSWSSLGPAHRGVWPTPGLSPPSTDGGSRFGSVEGNATLGSLQGPIGCIFIIQYPLILSSHTNSSIYDECQTWTANALALSWQWADKNDFNNTPKTTREFQVRFPLLWIRIKQDEPLSTGEGNWHETHMVWILTMRRTYTFADWVWHSCLRFETSG